MTVSHADLRLIILKWIKAVDRRGHTLRKLTSIMNFANENGVPLDGRHYEDVYTVLHEFYLEGIIIPGKSQPPVPDVAPGNMLWPSFRLTEYGKEVLDAEHFIPYDPDGYIADLEGRVESLDPVIITYLLEAQAALRHRLPLAAAVMVGCAAEKAILLLLDAVKDKFTNAKTEKNFKKKIEAGIYGKHDALRKYVFPAMKDRDLKDGLEILVDAAFNIMRSTRNDAGHPTGKDVKREVVRASLYVFPDFCERIYQLIDYFGRNEI